MKYTENYIKNYLDKEGYDLIEIHRKGKKNERYIKIKHRKCGKVYDTKVSKFFTEHQRCSCMRKNKYASISSKKDFQEFLDKKFGKSEYVIISDYFGRKKPIKIKHKCGYEYEIKRAEFLLESSGGKCPICNYGSHNNEKILNQKFKSSGANIILDEPFETGKILYRVKNLDCGHKYYIRTYDILKKNHHHICPICNPSGISSNEIEILNFISSFYKGKIIKKI